MILVKSVAFTSVIFGSTGFTKSCHVLAEAPLSDDDMELKVIGTRSSIG